MSKLKPRDLHKIQRRRARERRARALTEHLLKWPRITELVYEPSELTKRMLRGKP